MKLANPFTNETRWLFHDVQYLCWKCGENGQMKGGTELHHIVGRSSNSPLNGAVLCKDCHAGVTHTAEEEMELLNKTIIYLHSRHYVWTEKDMQFLRDNERLIKNNPLAKV